MTFVSRHPALSRRGKPAERFAEVYQQLGMLWEFLARLGHRPETVAAWERAQAQPITVLRERIKALLGVSPGTRPEDGG